MGEKPVHSELDGLTDGERLIMKALIENHKAVLLKVGQLESSVAECKIIVQNATRNQGTLATGAAKEHKMTTCGSKNFEGCGAAIYWEDRKPFNADGTPHRCRR